MSFQKRENSLLPNHRGLTMKRWLIRFASCWKPVLLLAEAGSISFWTTRHGTKKPFDLFKQSLCQNIRISATRWPWFFSRPILLIWIRSSRCGELLGERLLIILTLQTLKFLKMLWMLISPFIVNPMKNWLPYVPLGAKINVVYYTIVWKTRTGINCWVFYALIVNIVAHPL